ncbi:MAG: protease modulator HflC [Desulfobacterales bacterium]|nr:protease modulator HflC [Desulfobacterales bacterium]
MKTQYIIFIIIVALGFMGLAASAFVVDETQQVVVTQFNKVVGDPITEPGLNFRVPFIQRPNYFLKNIQEWDGEPGQIPTLDKTYIWLDTFARWRIVDPVAFFETVTERNRALSRLDDIINPAVRNAVTSHHLIETVRNSNRKMTTLEQIDVAGDAPDAAVDNSVEPSEYIIQTGREELSKEILKASQPKLEKFGIELIDVKIKRVNYVQKVRESVYGRMVAERNQMAEKIRSEGRGEAFRIEGDKEKDLKLIQSDAYRRAQEIKGKADAEATTIYAEAYNMDPEYYSFTKAMEVYQTSLGAKSKAVLSTDSEFLRYLKDFTSK